jgi:hypothetical protein
MDAWRTVIESRTPEVHRTGDDHDERAPDAGDGPVLRPASDDHDEGATQGGDAAEDRRAGPILGLPSEYTPADRERYGMATLAGMELLLRKGMAFDLISSIRQKALEHALSRATTHAEGGSSAVVTRGKGKLARMGQETVELVAVFNANWRAMAELGEKEGELRPIRMEDLKHHPTTASKSRREGQVEEGWIWSVGEGTMRAVGLVEGAWEGGEDMGTCADGQHRAQLSPRHRSPYAVVAQPRGEAAPGGGDREKTRGVPKHDSLASRGSCREGTDGCGSSPLPRSTSLLAQAGSGSHADGGICRGKVRTASCSWADTLVCITHGPVGVEGMPSLFLSRNFTTDHVCGYSVPWSRWLDLSMILSTSRPVEPLR